MGSTFATMPASKLDPIDIEKQDVLASTSEEEDRHPHDEFLSALFGLSEDQLQLYPGAFAYCRFLESSFAPLLADYLTPVWTALGFPRPQTVEECWPLILRICSTALSTIKYTTSLDDLCDTLLQSRYYPLSNTWRTGWTGASTRETQELCCIVIFAVMCWSTLSLQPELRTSELDTRQRASEFHALRIHYPVMSPSSVKLKTLKQPVHVVFRHFNRAVPVTRWHHSIGEPPVTDEARMLAPLEVSCLNYTCLRDIAKIRIVWVSDVARHLDFDATKRTLSLFKFPTFCSLDILSKKDRLVGALLHRGPVGEIYAPYDSFQDRYDFTPLHQEVLMSYRLLFGQSRSSRRLATTLLHNLKSSNPSHYDPLLDILCTSGRTSNQLRTLPLDFWPPSCHGFSSKGTCHLQEQSSYSPQDDFPFFGQRLAKLQQFNLQQRPSEWRDLWRDRRNPLQWYTFWAVLVVGGLLVMLSTVQVVIGIAQVVYSVPAR